MLRIGKKFASVNPLKESWVLFFATTILFIFSVLFQTSVASTVICYQVLLSLYFIILVRYLFVRRKDWNSPFCLAVFGIFGFFLLKGAYLEYPSDTWEYFRLIAEWQSKKSFSEFSSWNGRFWLDPARCCYLFYWSILQNLPRQYWVFGLDFISAGMTTLAFVQILSLAEEFQAKIKYVLWMALFGFIFTGVYNISYFYYLGLSANLVSFVLFYRFLLAMIHFRNGRRQEIWIGPGILITMFYNHIQGLMWIILAGITLAMDWFYSRPESQEKRRWRLGGYFLLALSSALILALHYGDFFENYFQHWGVYFDTLGRPGLIALVVGFFFRKRMRLLWLLNIVPVMVIVIPILAFPVFKYVIPNQVYGHRLLYLVPTGFLVFQVMRYLLKEKYLRQPLKEFIIILMLMIGLSFDNHGPWFGRLPFLFTPTPEELSLKTYFPIVTWLEENRAQQIKNCRYATDQVTDFLLTTYFGWPDENLRTIVRDSVDDEMHLAETGQRYCGIIIRDWTKIHLLPESRVNKEFHNWTPNLSQPDQMTTPKMKETVERLTAAGWRRESLPADYILLEKN